MYLNKLHLVSTIASINCQKFIKKFNEQNKTIFTVTILVCIFTIGRAYTTTNGLLLTDVIEKTLTVIANVITRHFVNYFIVLLYSEWTTLKKTLSHSSQKSSCLQET